MIEKYKSMSAEERERAQIASYNNTPGDLKYHDCPKCLNRGYIYTGINESYACDCMKIRTAKRRIINSGLADIAEYCTFENYVTTETWQEKIKKAAQHYVEYGMNNNNWFFVGGQSGAGKTHVCTAVTMAAIHSGKSALYMKWREEATRLKQAAADDEYQTLIEPYKRVDVLYIDDFFKAGAINGDMRPKDADVNLAFELIHRRSCENNKITIISTELQIQQIAQIDEALAGRIYERAAGGAYALNIAKDGAKNWRFRDIQAI